ncbi:MAG: DUF2723 domain-containing protein [Bacteroides sp.]|nr:DUF2723 domain-containing protein [Bacteroides sp.]MCM1379203.1 DUF2723 domain-containing protein [Bacteroides sp.]MCM1445148.1 DUF2723 domain-containing protein [Prevotella sp.]
MKRYNLINNSLGWLCFIIAAVSYLLTIEPTASFWDCPEFIAQGFKLEVGHPPGNPIFMLTARFFINFVGGEPGKVAMAVNAMNALLSAGTILLLFWTITHLMRRLLAAYKPDSELSAAQVITIMGSGLVGALAYAWSDTFWYSAVEGEVYAFSSFCTALVFWLILKWEVRADAPHSDRYLILIAYVIGVSIAVHLLNLLCIPAIVLVFYYRKFAKPSAKGSILALLVSFMIVATILFGLVPGFVEVAQYSELFFVNTLGLSYNSGVLAYTVFTLAVFIWTIYELYQQKSATRIKISFALSVLVSGIPFIGSSLWIPVVIIVALVCWLWWVKKLPVRVLNIVTLSIFVIFIGYSSYALLLIRSAAETPVNQNAPDNVFALSSYLNREQYGESPLLYGTTFASEVMRTPDGIAVGTDKYDYVKSLNPDKPHYDRVLSRTKYKYSPDLNMLFPRMYAAEHRNNYLSWAGAKESDLQAVNAHTIEGSPMTKPVRKPTFAQNLSYFVNYQLIHMYFRYFMWNFAGRQNDLQGNGEVNRGNWISSIPFIDNARLGDQSLLPDDFGKGNKGHNVFYMLPLILGLVGLIWQSLKGEKGIQQFWIVFFLFFMTGIAIVLYLNQTPLQPRERDYAYAGSFYAFAIWIGLGVGAIAAGIDKLMKKTDNIPAAVIASLIGLIVPIQMVSQTWDDHDRSGRYTARDFGMNYLASLEPNAIIFTNGDNDTFPLWYAQEVEGYRTDVRVINLSYLTTDWYAAQHLLPAYEAAPANMLADKSVFGQGRRQSGYVIADDTLRQNALDWLSLYYGETPERNGSLMGVKYPVIHAGKIVIPGDSLRGEDDIVIDLPTALNDKNHQPIITQADMLMLDIIASSAANGWNRPVYIANTVPDSYYLKLNPYMYATGMAHRVMPHRSLAAYKADNDDAYRNITERFRWGGLDAEGGDEVYLDETVSRMVASTRYAIIEVIESLYNAGQYDRALNLLNLMTEKLPTKNAPYGIQVGDNIAQLYIALAEETGSQEARDRAEQLYQSEISRYGKYLPYLLSLDDGQYRSLSVNDRAVFHIRDSQGDYSYLASLIAGYAQDFGQDKANAFLQDYALQTGIDLIEFYNRFASR